MKKKIFSVLCAAAFLVGSLGAPVVDSGIKLINELAVSADDVYTYGDFEYVVLDNGKIKLQKYLGNDSTLIIPNEINEKPVTDISFDFFDYSRNYYLIKKVVIPNNVTNLENGGTLITSLFSRDNIALDEIIVDENNSAYTSIDGVLYDKTLEVLIHSPRKVNNVNIPNSVNSIQARAFWKNTNIEEIIIPANVWINNGAFSDCKSLNSISIGENAIIGALSFENCSNLKSVTIPKSCQSLGKWAFGYYDDTYGNYYKYNDFKIYCYSNTVGEKYAIDNGFDYELLDKPVDPTPADPAPVDPAPAKKSLSNATVKTSNQTYTGKSLTPAVTVTLDGKTLKKGTDYTAAYKNNKNCGKATVTVNGMNDYDGSASGSFIIKPKRSAAKKTVSPKKKQIKVTWKKTAGGVTGYQVQIALNKKFTKARKTYVVKKAASVSKTIKGLRSKKVYYTRVRAYKTVASKNYYGAWSGIKKARCK